MTEAEWFASECPLGMLEACRATLGSRQKRMICLAAFRVLPVGTLSRPTREWLSLAEELVEQPTLDLRSSKLYHGLRTCWSLADQVTYAMCQHVLSEDVGSLVWCAMMLRNDYHWQSDDLVDRELAALLRDIVGNPFRPVAFSPQWRTTTAMHLARGMYDSRDFSAMPILADALQDAGCENEDVLNHCRDEQQVHVRGCWVVDLVLEKA